MTLRRMKHNPAFLTRDELVRGFVVRQADLELLLERLREEGDGPNQHILLIGPRGMGKTTLVLRAAAAVELDPALSKKWYPLVFGEESYEVGTAAEFWLEAVMHLGQQTGEERWKNAYRVLRDERDEQRLYEKALARLLDFADERGKKLLVIVENLNMILGEQLSADDGWTLRHTLQNEPRIMLLATATTRFEAIDNVKMAMYDLFWTEHLKPLNTDECRTVWRSITGHELAGDRIRPVEILTGGSPRLLSILASFAADMSLRELMQNLTKLVDDHTSYFKSNLEVLPTAERKVYVTLADLWSPATARDVAAAARIDVNKASALLHRLLARGAVSEVKREGRTITYQVAERLYNIYHLMRRHGDEQSRVRAVVDFMVQFYEERDLADVTRTIAEEACKIEPDARTDHYFAFRALVQQLPGDELRDEVIRSTNPAFFEAEDAPAFIKNMRRSVSEMRQHGVEAAVLRKELAARVLGLIDNNELTAAEDAARQICELMPGHWHPLGTLAIVLSMNGRHEEARSVIDQLQSLAPSDTPWEYAAAFVWHRSDELERALQAGERLVDKYPESVEAWTLLSNIRCDAGDLPGAETAMQRSIALDKDSIDAWSHLARINALLQRYSDTEVAARRSLELGSESPFDWGWLGASLMLQGKLTDECENALRKSISNDPVANAIVIGWLRKLLKRRLASAAATKEAATRYQQLTEGREVSLAALAWRVYDGNWSSLFSTAEGWARAAIGRQKEAIHYALPLVALLGAQGKWPEAFVELQPILSNPEFVETRNHDLVDIFIRAAAGNVTEALSALTASPAKEKLEPIVTALQMLAGQSPNAPQEVAEIAKDIIARIEKCRGPAQPAAAAAPARKSPKKATPNPVSPRRR